MIVVTGGAGFIGSNVVRALLIQGKEVAVVDDLSDGFKFKNLLGLDICDYFDKDNFKDLILECIELERNALNIEAIIHNGGCSSTTEWDGRYILDVNYEYSRRLLTFCQIFKIPFIYASSASVYGLSKNFREIPENEVPINVYGYSKLLLDNKVRRTLRSPECTSQVVGLRYFNVYGPGEHHKEGQSSPIFRYYQNLKDFKKAEIYSGKDGTGVDAKEHKRDFIYVGDVVNVILWFLENSDKSGIFNVGTGECHSFSDVADYVVWYFEKTKSLSGFYGKEFKPLPEHLKGRSQPFTKADLTQLRKVGYNAQFTSLKDGVCKYLDWLEQQ